MKRRFVSLLCLTFATSASPTAIALAQQRIPRVAYVTAGDPAVRTKWIEQFRMGMREHDGREGETYTLEIYGAKGRLSDLPSLVKEVLDRKPDIVLVSTTPASLAVKAATTTVPVVAVAVGDPVGVGLVSNLARPEGNITGVSNYSVELPGKRLQLLAELIPNLRRVAILVNPDDENATLQIDRTREVADGLGIRLDPIAQIRNADDTEEAYRKASQAEAAVRLTDPVATQLRPRTMALAAAYRLPTIYAFREDVDAGGLISYGTDQGANYYRAAYFVSRILRGASPGSLPMEQPTQFEMLVNVKTARDLGLQVPASILVRCDEIIE